MIQSISVHNQEEAKKAVIAIGQELIRRADDICRDIERVSSITILSTITADEIVTVDVTKNYGVAYEEKENTDVK